MHRCKHTFIFALLLCSSLIAKGQSAYVSRLKDAAALLPSKAVQTDSLCKIILEEIGAKQPSNDSLFVLTYSLLGNSNMYQGKLNLALDFYNKSLYHNRENILPGENMNYLANKAIALEKQHRYEEASQAHYKALEFTEENGDSTTIAAIWFNLGTLSHHMKDDERAIEILNKLYIYYSVRRDTVQMANTLNNIATCYYPGQLQTTEKNLTKSLELLRQINNYYHASVTVNNLVELKIRQHNYTEARQLLQENISLCEEKGFLEALSAAHRLSGQCEIESGGDLVAAATSLEKSRELANKTGRKDYLRDIREAELLLQARAGNFEGVKKVLEDYKLMNDELAQESARILNSEFQTIYEVKKITQQKDLLEEGISLRNRQLVLSLLALFAAVLAVGIIASQHIRLRRTMKTMYRMNVELANNAVISTGSLNSDTVSDDSDENNGEERISLSNLYTETLRRIERDKLYLDPVFSLQELGELINRSPRYVSQALGEIGKVSFPNLVNNFRINEARRLIANNPDITVIELMEKTGFGSRQSFNRNFKTATGFTPSEYQQRARDTQA